MVLIKTYSSPTQEEEVNYILVSPVNSSPDHDPGLYRT